MRPSAQRGSILLTVLLVCLGTAVMIAGLAGAVTLAVSGREAEQEGRRLLELAEKGLVGGLALAHVSWEPAEIETDEGVTVTLTPVLEGSGRVLRLTATARSSDGACVVSALLERGVDGFDLPIRAAAAGSLAWDPARVSTLVVASGGSGATGGGAGTQGWEPVPTVPPTSPPVRVSVRAGERPAVLGDEVIMEAGRSWVLDPAVLALASDAPAGGHILLVPPGSSVRQLLPEVEKGGSGLAAEVPVVVIGSGEGSLDLRDLGDLFAVVLAGAGGVELDGTNLHGAVFAEGTLHFGDTGTIVFHEAVLDWARRNSITRVRLVPGTREASFTGFAP